MLALGLFLVTLALVIWQPRGLPIGWSALGGALVALALGIVHPSDVPTVWHIVWDATFTLIGLILISLVLDAAGFFEWAALRLARLAGGRGGLLFLLLSLLTAAVAAILANDGAVLILTPLVLEMLHALRLPPRALLAFVLTTGFIADAASLPFKISNLTNIIVANYFGLSFAEYARVMGVVNLVAVAVSLVVAWWLFRHDVPARVVTTALPHPGEAIRDRFVFATGLGVLPALFLGYLFSHGLGLPTSFITGTGAAVLMLAAGREHFLRRQPRAVIPLLTLLREAPWQVVVFSLAMYLVVYGLRNEGLTGLIAQGLQNLAQAGLMIATLGSGLVFGFLSAVMNNLPTVLIGSLAIEEAHLSVPMAEAMIYANVVGCNIGPKFTPIGSLATLLWLHVLAQRGLRIGWLEYCRYGLLLTLPVLVVTLLGLAGWLMFLRA
ncbi:MAG: arsenical efflux pump membrane protein ArsB [Burkholderiales bacterium]|nr:arsenical efflux pump membrane protein ArsB [Burkholderiales bacterium]